jgi:hypothetical protein
VCFVGEEDITLKILHRLVLVLFTVRNPLVLILVRDNLLNKYVLILLTAVCVLLQFALQLSPLDRAIVVCNLRFV